MIRRQTRGLGLATVLMLAALMLVVGLALASLCVLNLNMTARWTVAQQSYQMVLAAVTQIEHDVGTDPVLVKSTIGQTIPDFNFPAHYPTGQNILQDDAAYFPGTVSTTFDTTQDHYSTDNLSGGTAVAGWRDRGTTQTSVPADTVDLILKVAIGGHVSFYEAFVNRHWPYALTTIGSVAVVSDQAQAANGSDVNLPSTIQGKSLLFSTGTLETGGYTNGAIFLPTTDYNLIRYQTMSPDGPSYIVGGAQPASGNLPATTGNRVIGRIDRDLPTDQVMVLPGNTQTGGVAVAGNTAQLLTTLQQACTYTMDLGGFLQLDQIVNGSVPKNWGAPLDFQTAMETITAASNPNAPPQAPPIVPFYLMQGEVQLKNNNYLLNMNAGNTVVCMQPDESLSLYSEGCNISMDKATLLVQGNLDLGSNATLTGKDSSLIVEGDLLLDGATINSGGKPMVILCDRLVCRAGGTFQGLIVARRSAIIIPPTVGGPTGGLTIQGALVAGQEPQAVYGVDYGGAGILGAPGYRFSCAPWTPPGCFGPPPQSCGSAQRTVDPISSVTGGTSILGLLFMSTNLTYDPKSIGNLNRYGPMQLVSVDLIP